MHELASPAAWIIGMVCAVPWGWVFYRIGVRFERRRRDHVEKYLTKVLAMALLKGSGATREATQNVADVLRRQLDPGQHVR